MEVKGNQKNYLNLEVESKPTSLLESHRSILEWW